MYSLYLDGMLLPVTPKKLEMHIGGRSRLVSLMDGGQASLPAGPELTEVRFSAMLPQTEYPFARYEHGFLGAEVYLGKLEGLKADRKPFRFVISRWTPAGKRLFDTNLRVTLEEYDVEEDAEKGFDLELRIVLRQYREFGAKKLEIDAGLPDAPVILEENRALDSAEGKGSGGKSGNSSGRGKGILAPSTGTKEAKAVAEKAASTAAKGTTVTTSIPGLSTLLGTAAAGAVSDAKTKLFSRR